MGPDPEMMTEQIQAVSRILLRHLVKMGATPDDAQDLVQEALVRWLVHLDAVAPERVVAWLFRVTVNLYYDWCRRQQRTGWVPLDTVRLVDAGSPEAWMLAQEQHDRARRAWHALSFTQQHLLMLKYGEQLSNAAIAALLGCSPATVSTYLYRARNKYRKAYEEDA